MTPRITHDGAIATWIPGEGTRILASAGEDAHEWLLKNVPRGAKRNRLMTLTRDHWTRNERIDRDQKHRAIVLNTQNRRV